MRARASSAPASSTPARTSTGSRGASQPGSSSGTGRTRSPTRPSSSGSPSSVRESCRPPTRWARTTRAALCHELRGERDDADRYIGLAFASLERVRHLRAGGSIHLPPLALALARRGRFDEALGLDPARARGASVPVQTSRPCARSQRRRSAGTTQPGSSRPHVRRPSTESNSRCPCSPIGSRAGRRQPRATRRTRRRLLGSLRRRVRRARRPLGGGVVAAPARRGVGRRRASSAPSTSSRPRSPSSWSSARCAKRSGHARFSRASRSSHPPRRSTAAAAAPPRAPCEGA